MEYNIIGVYIYSTGLGLGYTSGSKSLVYAQHSYRCIDTITLMVYRVSRNPV